MAHPWVLEMTWKHICFCHWPFSETLLQSYLPRGWTIDTYRGEAWLSVVPFAMENVRLRGLPAVAGFRDVPELNLRTYVKRGTERAVFFFSLDARSKALVHAARFTTGLPYRHADITFEQSGEAFMYRSNRIEPGTVPGKFSADYRAVGVARTAEPDSIEEFLHERYYFVTRRGLMGRVIHEPYRVRAAEVEIFENTLPAMIGHTLAARPALCYYADRLEVRAAYGGPPRP